RLQADRNSLYLVLLDPFLESPQLVQRPIERLLGARRRRAGVTEDAGPVFERLVARGNGVAQAVLLAHLREQPGAHAAVQHVDRPNRVVILGVAERHARIGDANLRLGSFLADVTIAALRLADPKRRLGTGLPVVEQPADLLLE